MQRGEGRGVGVQSPAQTASAPRETHLHLPQWRPEDGRRGVTPRVCVGPSPGRTHPPRRPGNSPDLLPADYICDPGDANRRHPALRRRIVSFIQLSACVHSLVRRALRGNYRVC